MAVRFNKLIQAERDIEDHGTADLLVLWLLRLRRSDSRGDEDRPRGPELVAELRSDESAGYDPNHDWGRSLETVRRSLDGKKMVFMSHKTDDPGAETEARYIQRTLGVKVYMAEWDDNVHGDSMALPEYIMRVIGVSEAFLVHVIDEIKVSMWIGYEIGGAHAKNKPRAKIMYHSVSGLASVVEVLETLDCRCRLVRWLGRHV